MLSHIHIRNFAIIESLELDLSSGLTVMTGETGAGKSILIDAIGLVMGDRADSNTVRHGTHKTEITLLIDLEYCPPAQRWLEIHELTSDEETHNECVLRRVININGKSRAWINGTPATLKLLRELAEQLVDIHGQHEHHSLMNTVTQRGLLDEYASNTTIRTQTIQSFKNWQGIYQRLQILSGESVDTQAKLDLLRFQTQELDELALQENELTELNKEHTRLSAAESLIQSTALSLQQLYDAENNDTVYSLLSSIIQRLEQDKQSDTQLTEPLTLLQSALIQVQESSDFLRNYKDSINIDPERLDWLDTRLTRIHDLSRKHQVNTDELFIKWQSLLAELNTLQSDDYDLDALQAQEAEARKHYLQQASKLHKSRLQAAKTLSQKITASMQTLGMEGGIFDIKVQHDTEKQPAKYGLDHIEFQVSANPGQPLQLLANVASGGELSRISLAIQMIAAQKVSLPALIFDEVDTGIGGGIAEVVGEQLRNLGENRQVLCVTHLPQVAAKAHQHLFVHKEKGKDITATSIISLKGNERRDEIARMMGGVKITENTLSLATEMLAS